MALANTSQGALPSTMTAPIETSIGISKASSWTGRVLSGLASTFLLFDGVMKLVKPEVVVKSTLELGYPESSITGIGITLIIATLLYLTPRLSVLGAILLTGYLGGAVATHVRVGAGAFNVVFPVIFGVIVWAGLYLRSEAVRRALGFVGSRASRREASTASAQP